MPCQQHTIFDGKKQSWRFQVSMEKLERIQQCFRGNTEAVLGMEQTCKLAACVVCWGRNLMPLSGWLKYRCQIIYHHTATHFANLTEYSVHSTPTNFTRLIPCPTKPPDNGCRAVQQTQQQSGDSPAIPSICEQTPNHSHCPPRPTPRLRSPSGEAWLRLSPQRR